MTLEALRESLPPYAKDLQLNLSNVLQQVELTPQQSWGTAVASAIACRHRVLLEAVVAEAKTKLSPEALEAAHAAAAIMGMNNVYYRFVHLTSNEKYRTMRARLRMNVIRSHGIEPVDFELWCVAVSAINGCAVCMDSHEKVLRNHGISDVQVQAALRIAATVNAISAVIRAESALTAT